MAEQSQSEKFKDAARELDCDDDEPAFARRLESLLKRVHDAPKEAEFYVKESEKPKKR